MWVYVGICIRIDLMLVPGVFVRWLTPLLGGVVQHNRSVEYYDDKSTVKNVTIIHASCYDRIPFPI